VVVAFSGLDGAGKSSQATGLHETLIRLGYEAIIVRTRITWDDALWPIAEPIKRVLTRRWRCWLPCVTRKPGAGRRPRYEREIEAKSTGHKRERDKACSGHESTRGKLALDICAGSHVRSG
jgi:hypothetical protein